MGVHHSSGGEPARHAGAVVGYVRVSTKEQANSKLSLTHQDEKIRHWAAAHDLELSKVYRDEAESAKDLNRPAVQELLREVERGRVAHVVIYKLDRLTRSVGDLGKLVELFDRKGVGLAAVVESLDTSSASGRLVVNMLGAIAQWERETISERTQAALDVKRQRGERLGGFVPYGWTSQRGKLVQNPKEHEVVVWITEARWGSRWGGPLGYQDIADKMNRTGVKPRTGRKWYASTIRGICIRLSRPGVNGPKTHRSPDHV